MENGRYLPDRSAGSPVSTAVWDLALVAVCGPVCQRSPEVGDCLLQIGEGLDVAADLADVHDRQD
jgi:hypothetical protein